MVKIKFKKSNRNVYEPSFPIETLHQRLKRDKAVDLTNNFIIKDLENDYVQVLPIDSKKLYK